MIWEIQILLWDVKDVSLLFFFLILFLDLYRLSPKAKALSINYTDFILDHPGRSVFTNTWNCALIPILLVSITEMRCNVNT